VSRRRALGKGLDAIFGADTSGGDGAGAASSPGPGTAVAARESDNGAGAAAAGEGLPTWPKGQDLVDVERIWAGRGQPRRSFDEQSMQELADSIKQNGIIQPLVVTRGKGGFEVIAGERRLRAAMLAGLQQVPVIVREEVSESELVELALVENIQRQDLAPLEEASAYRRLVNEYGYTQEDVARRVGKSRASVANSLRLIGLPAPVKELLESAELSEGHARALLALPTAASQIKAAKSVCKQGLSVRQTEKKVRSIIDAQGDGAKVPASAEAGPSALEEQLGRALSTRVHVRRKGKGGRVEIDFYSEEELSGLADRLLA
jgi:ParB family chromosome partitioning protein